MASLDQPRTFSTGRSSGSVILAALGRFAAWNDARITRKALASLSDHELDDIGLTRGEIDLIR
ncbi:MAG: DUF1127 domain-containing protein [Paracoccaceae bacterium]|nr:DUF1127 domain-containing protein [Paracoccaceae bacterium]